MSDDRSRSGEDDGPEEDVERAETVGDLPGVGEDGSDRGESDNESGEEWKFSLSDIEKREAESEDADGTGDGEAHAPEPNSTPIDRGAPSIENAAFVLLGMLLMIAVLFRLVAAGIAG